MIQRLVLDRLFLVVIADGGPVQQHASRSGDRISERRPRAAFVLKVQQPQRSRARSRLRLSERPLSLSRAGALLERCGADGAERSLR